MNIKSTVWGASTFFIKYGGIQDQVVTSEQEQESPRRYAEQNISQHVRNIYEEGELIDEATHKKFLSVRQEGNRQVKRNLDYYNLELQVGF